MSYQSLVKPFLTGFLNTYVTGCESNERIAIMHSACKPLHMSSGEKTSWLARQNNNECMAMAA